MAARVDRFELSVVGTEALAANFRRLDARANRELDAAVKRNARLLFDTTYKFTPVDTGFMREHLRVYQTRRLFEVGWNATDFFDNLLPFYPPFVEYGTRYMVGRFPLTRAFQRVYPQWIEDVQQVIVRNIERGNF